jgi:ribulose-5-phosphate 4-epimerase/fuculose-1-phosphate aldolase
MRISDTNQILIKPSGSSLGDLQPEDFVVIDLTGKVLKGDQKPSSETPMHTAVYQRREDVVAVVHTHSFYVDVMTIAGQELLPIMFSGQALALMDGVKIAPWRLPGSKEIADLVSQYLQKRDAVLLEYHGSVTVGKTIESAYHLASKLEEMAKKQWMASQIGTPRIFPKAERQKMRELFSGKDDK